MRVAFHVARGHSTDSIACEAFYRRPEMGLCCFSDWMSWTVKAFTAELGCNVGRSNGAGLKASRKSGGGSQGWRRGPGPKGRPGPREALGRVKCHGLYGRGPDR